MVEQTKRGFGNAYLLNPTSSILISRSIIKKLPLSHWHLSNETSTRLAIGNVQSWSYQKCEMPEFVIEFHGKFEGCPPQQTATPSRKKTYSLLGGSSQDL